MYNELDYLTFDILNDIERRIVDLYNRYSLLLKSTYIPKEWVKNEFLYVDDVKHIEDGIDKIGKAFGYPNGWQTTRQWDLLGSNNISYKDLNRWIMNIELLMNSTFTPLMPSNNLLPRNGFLYPAEDLYPEDDLYNNYLLPTNNLKE